MTGKGAAREKAFKNADDMQAKSAEYERAVQAGRQEEISMRALIRQLEEASKNKRADALREEAGAAKAIADEILRQLGGRRFLVMTGARNLMSFDKLDDERKWPGLQVQFPQGKAKYMRIALAPSDTYTIQFMTRTGKVAKEMDDIYVDVLQRVVSDYTGLALSL
jgi:precorrin-6x reductase